MQDLIVDMGAKARLLVADDSLTIQKVIRLALANEGYEIQAVSNGNAVAERVALFQPHVILIDASLPDRSVFEIRKEFLNNPDFKNLKFILMSNAFEKIDEKELAELDFHGRLLKPFDPSHLRQTLQGVLEKVEVTSPTLGRDLWQQEPAASAQAPEPATVEPEEDIKKLTETTIRMSGLDQYQWSVDDASVRISAVESHPEPQVFMGDEIDISAPLQPTRSPPPPFQTGGIKSESPQPHDPHVIPLTTEQMEELLSKQLAETIERITKQMLPDIAEHVIRQEIHRMLSDPPKGH